MRREEYERTYGRRSHYPMPPPMPPPQEDPRSRRSRTKMKCLISIGLILPALAAVIGVAAWAVSADVVMNSGNNNRGNKADNHMMQNFASENDNRRDIFRANEDSQKFRPQTQSSTPPTTTTTQSTTTTTTTTTTPAPVTLSPQEETDVNAILSKLISASGAASGGNGPRFVVVAPLPDNADIGQGGQNSLSAISRVDNTPSTKPHSRDDAWHVSGKNRPEPDLVPAASSQNTQRYHVTMGRSASQSNLTNRIGVSKSDSSATRRIGSKPYMMSVSSNSGGAFHNPQIDLTGFEPYDTMMHEFQTSQNTQHNHQPNFQSPGSFTSKRGPPQGHFNSRNQHKPLPMQQFDPNDQHIFHHHIPDHNIHGLQGSPSHPQGLMVPPGVGLKPIQQQLHHMDPLQSAESNRWGNVGFHGPPSGVYHHKPPEGISLSISSPANSGTHVSVKEPVSVIKSFFLPFLPKPRLNMNARVVFGVVLDKGMGIGGDKKKFH